MESYLSRFRKKESTDKEGYPSFIYIAILSVLLFGCINPTEGQQKKEVNSFVKHKNFNPYWYQGEAEISNYKLNQARYGNMNEGHATLIFVTEPFSKKNQVKADRPTKEDIPILKLNSTRKFNTGIYPYSLMTSTFVPINPALPAIKNSFSAQEWCGHSYMQSNNRNDKIDILLRSYFESEGDKKIALKEAVLEDELWVKLRFDPNQLPVGDFEAIPSFAFLRLKHQEIKAYTAKARLTKKDRQSTYSIEYPSLNRTLTITFNNDFPYVIQGWNESYKSGWGAKAKVLTTEATLIKTIKSDYWNKHDPKHEKMRTQLGL